MNIQEALQHFQNLVDTSASKAEIKTIRAFMKILENLEARDWKEGDLDKVEQKLSDLELEKPTINRKKFLRKKYHEFITFLKNEFSLITKGSYTTIGMVFGMIFGQSMGLALGLAFAGTTGLAIGMSMGTGLGMAFGIVIGAMKETEAKKQGKVLG